MPWSSVSVCMLPMGPGELCQRRYHGHPRGCPNYQKRATCPPKAGVWSSAYLCSRRWFAIWNAFDFGAHVERMRVAHPAWSERQLANCLYWQGGARKKLREEVARFLRDIAGLRPAVEYVPEAHGVDVTATMLTANVRLEWPPQTVAYQVALVGL